MMQLLMSVPQVIKSPLHLATQSRSIPTKQEAEHMTQPIKLIIDTDPGIDDAMAIFYAVAAPDIELVGLTSIFGNVTTEQATRNALHLLERADLPDVPVAEGASKPRALPAFPPSHGQGGGRGAGRD